MAADSDITRRRWAEGYVLVDFSVFRSLESLRFVGHFR